MGRVLSADVACHLNSSSPYIRKKAALALNRILKRVPELSEHHVDVAIALLRDRSHGVLITAIQLLVDVVSHHSLLRASIMRVVPSLVKMLRNLLNLGYSPEHDISGIADPFLQVKVLKFLAILGEGDDQASEAMNDILAQVATNTETNRNAGNAVLYECVKVTMIVKSESGLKTLAINILGRFLLNRDNNIRYVALNSLSDVVHDDVTAVQRHRATILDCLKDPDVSIRQRALELTYQLVNADNVEDLVREMLNYLVIAPPEHRGVLCSRVATVIDKYASSSRWQIETLIAMLSIAGNYCERSVVSATVSYISLYEVLRGSATHKLFRLLRDELPRVQITLMHVAIWCIGEFGDCLLETCSKMDEPQNMYHALPFPEILGLLDAVLKSHLASTLTKNYVLTALVKLSSRLQTGTFECQALLQYFVTSLSLELQQRSCEYTSLFENHWSTVQQQALARMPAIDLVAFRSKERTIENPASLLQGASRINLDSMDLLNVVGASTGDETRVGVVGGQTTSMDDADLLSDIFAGHSASLECTPESKATKSESPTRGRTNILEKRGLSVTMDLVKRGCDPSVIEITYYFSNATSVEFNKFVFQAAVPKYVSMEWNPASADTIPPNKLGIVTQTIKVVNHISSKPLMMRIKIQYIVEDRLVAEHAQISSFPEL